MPASFAPQTSSPQFPLPIYQPSRSIPRYLLYDISHVSYLRSHHAILGVLIGTLPQIPQQSVFLGLPLELQPEEAKLLVDKGIAYIVNDREWHDKDFRQECGRERETIIENLKIEGLEIAKEVRTLKKERTRLILQEQGRGREKGKDKKIKEKKKNGERTATSGTAESKRQLKDEEESNPGAHKVGEEEKDQETEEETLFDPSPDPQRAPHSSDNQPSQSSTTHSRSRSTSAHEPKPWTTTPTTTSSISKHIAPPTPTNSEPPSLSLPSHQPKTITTTTTALLFTHLHSQGYFLSPGLRFGCHFSVYPGDPLRFHSHFLANAYAWREERPLGEIVGGGRLGTGVKKGWLVGGLAEGKVKGEEEEDDDEGKGLGKGGEVRCFCIEWGGM